MAWILLLMLAFSGAVASGQAPTEQSVPAPGAAPVVAADEMEKPLPDVKELIQAVEKHEDRDEAILQQYTYHAHHVEEEFDSNEATKKTKTLDTESIPIDGVRVARTVAKDGKPLTPDEAKKEDADFSKQVEENKKNKAKYAERREQAEREGKSNNDFLPASRMLQLGTFSNERRVLLDGRPTIVVEYAGNRDVKTKNASEKVVEDLVGTVWIDEQDKEIARVEGQFLADYKLGFGLIVDIHKGLKFTLAKKKVNDEVWLPVEFGGEGKASLGWLVYRVHGRLHVSFSDYRKYHANATILGSNGPIDENGKPIAAPKSPATPTK